MGSMAFICRFCHGTESAIFIIEFAWRYNIIAQVISNVRNNFVCFHQDQATPPNKKKQL